MCVVLLFIAIQGTGAEAAGPPRQITKVVLYKKYPTFIVLKVTAKNTTKRQVKLVGYQRALDKNGYTTYRDPDFNEINLYNANNLCTGDMLNGYWSAGQTATGTWCFAVPKGKTIKSVYVSASRYGDAMFAKAVLIKN